MGARQFHPFASILLLAAGASILSGAGPDPHEPGPAVVAAHLEVPAERSAANDGNLPSHLEGASAVSTRVSPGTTPHGASESDDGAASNLPPRHSDNEARPLGLPRTSAAAPAGEPGSGTSKPAASEVRTLAALAGVIGVILAIAWSVRRVARSRGGLASAVGAGGRAPAGLLSVLGRYPIARGQTLILMRVDRRVLLLSQTWARGGARLSTLAEISDPDEVASILVKAQDAEGESVSQRFKAIVEKLNAEPAERAVTVVPPMKRADWFERDTRRSGVSELGTVPGAPAATRSVERESSRPVVSTATVDGAAALRSRLESMRAGGRHAR